MYEIIPSLSVIDIIVDVSKTSVISASVFAATFASSRILASLSFATTISSKLLRFV